MIAKMAAFPSPATTLNPCASLNFLKTSSPQLSNKLYFAPKLFTKSTSSRNISRYGNPLLLLQCTKFSTPSLESETESDYDSTEEGEEGEGQTPLPVSRRRRRRYRKQYPGEKKGITEEMRFVAMKLRNSKSGAADKGEIEETWQPSMEGFLKYLVDSKLVFSTIERIVDESTDVSCMFFLYFFQHCYNCSRLASITFMGVCSFICFVFDLKFWDFFGNIMIHIW
ncbi:hypothetical protein ACS0TY_024246 [Phlomoides rotata]